MASVVIKSAFKKYVDLEVLHGIDVTINDGEFVVLVGPSGCGKSTTLRIAAGLEIQDSGIVKINVNLISEPKICHLPPEKRNIGFMFQDFALFPHFSFPSLSLSPSLIPLILLVLL